MGQAARSRGRRCKRKHQGRAGGYKDELERCSNGEVDDAPGKTQREVEAVHGRRPKRPDTGSPLPKRGGGGRNRKTQVATMHATTGRRQRNGGLKKTTRGGRRRREAQRGAGNRGTAEVEEVMMGNGQWEDASERGRWDGMGWGFGGGRRACAGVRGRGFGWTDADSPGWAKLPLWTWACGQRLGAAGGTAQRRAVAGSEGWRQGTYVSPVGWY